MTYTDTPLPHIRVLWRPSQFTRIDNAGFESSTTGWSVSAGINAAGTSITRTTADSHASTACGVLVTTSTDGSGVNFDLGSDTYFSAAAYGTMYTAVVWLKRVSGATKAKIILGSQGTAADRAELDIDLRDQWQAYRVNWLPTANRTDAQLAIVNGYAAVLTVRIDTVSLYQADAFSQVENSNFRTDTTGWDDTGAYIAGAASSLTRLTTAGMDPDNQFCAAMATTTTNGSGVSYPFGTRKFTSGRTYRLRAAIRSVSGSTSCRLRLGSIGTAADRASSTVTLTTDFQIFELDWTPSGDEWDACVAITNASGVAMTIRFGLVEVYESSDDISTPVAGQPYAMSLDWKAGDLRQSSRTPPGTATLTLSDAGKRLFPQNSSSSLSGSVVAGRRLWARATYANDIFPIFYGTIDTIDPDGTDLTTTITATDPLDEIASIDYEAGFTENETYAQVRALILASLPSTRVNATSSGIEGSLFFSGNESQKALSILESMNEATGTYHYVRPHTMAEIMWQYTTIDRATLTDATVSAETINDDFADMGGLQADRKYIENQQFVPWQGYERGKAPDDDGTGFGYVMRAIDRGGGYAVGLLDEQDPYLHFLDPAFGTDDNIPEPTFERITRINKKGRKKVRQIRVYPDPFVPFDMEAGETRDFVFDFSVPMSGTTVTLDGPTGATNILASDIESYPRHIVFRLYAADADTVDFFGVAATPWLPLDEEVANILDYDSIATLGLTFEGPSIQTPYIGSAGMAEGLANYRNWRYGSSRLNPWLLVDNRFSSGIARMPGQHVTVTSARWGLSSLVMIVAGVQGSMDTGSRSWLVTYTLEECPTGAPWFTLGTSLLAGTDELAH